jgi:hypothetical protein
VSRVILEEMHARLKALHYRSHVRPELTSCAIFQSAIVPAYTLRADEANPDARLYVLDDRVFSLRSTTLGFEIWATIDTETCHDGYVGTFGKMLDAHEEAKRLANNVTGAK